MGKKEIGTEKLGFGYTLEKYLDHTSILSWINYMAHRTSVGKTVTTKTFDGKDHVDLPSGKKIFITITIEEVKEKNVYE